MPPPFSSFTYPLYIHDSHISLSPFSLLLFLQPFPISFPSRCVATSPLLLLLSILYTLLALFAYPVCARLYVLYSMPVLCLSTRRLLPCPFPFSLLRPVLTHSLSLSPPHSPSLTLTPPFALLSLLTSPQKLCSTPRVSLYCTGNGNPITQMYDIQLIQNYTINRLFCGLFAYRN